jgi:hypothetical protein
MALNMRFEFDFIVVIPRSSREFANGPSPKISDLPRSSVR